MNLLEVIHTNSPINSKAMVLSLAYGDICPQAESYW